MSVSYLDYALTPTIGHEVPILTQGFSNIGRWLQLSTAALNDLCTSASLPAPSEDQEFWASTAVYIVLPEFDDRFASDSHCAEDNLAQHYRAPLLHRLAAVFAPRWVTLVPHGRAAVFEVCGTVPWQPGLERAIVVATDSLVDASGLRWLEDTRRLKSDMNPVGLCPGEASVAVLLEDPRVARHRGARPLAFIQAISTDIDREREEDGSAGGAGLAQVVARAVREAATLPTSYIADLNGEVWRARELAMARQRLEVPGWPEPTILPALSVGDPGTAMSALQIAVAVASLQRGWARDSSVLLTSSDLGGRVASAVIGTGDSL